METLTDDDGNKYEVVDNNWPTDFIVIKPLPQPKEEKASFKVTEGFSPKDDLHYVHVDLGDITGSQRHAVATAIEATLKYLQEDDADWSFPDEGLDHLNGILYKARAAVQKDKS